MNVRDAFASGETLVLGHRGAKAYAPMNTIPSFELALQQGAHGIELDVQLTKDQHPVVIHDFTVDATTNGSGRVSRMTLAEIRTLDAGSWMSPDYAGVSVPTLEEVFDTVGARCIVNVEIKSVSFAETGIERRVAALIERFGLQSQVIVSSFNPLTLRRFRRITPDVATGYLVDKRIPTSLLAVGLSYDAWHPSNGLVTGRAIEKHRQVGRSVNVWTVNDAARARDLAEMGVNAIITDVPDVISRALAR